MSNFTLLLHQRYKSFIQCLYAFRKTQFLREGIYFAGGNCQSSNFRKLSSMIWI